jgi:hypothetical protein
MKSASVPIALPDSVVIRIGQLLRLLASDQPGEVVAAAAAIGRTLVAAGTDLHHLADVAERGLRSVPTPPRKKKKAKAKPEPVVDEDSPAGMIKFCTAAIGELDEREAGFIQSIAGLLRRYGGSFEPTPKQFGWLLSIYQRLRDQQQ